MSQRMLECNETKKIIFTKVIHRKTPVMASFSVQMQTCELKLFAKETPSQILFHENCEVLKNIIFTERCYAPASNSL